MVDNYENVYVCWAKSFESVFDTVHLMLGRSLCQALATLCSKKCLLEYGL